MKKIGSVADFGPQRDKELLAAFRDQLHLLGSIPTKELFTRAAKMPASRFWVSERRAAAVISKMLRGDRILSMNTKKREMYLELYRRVRRIREEVRMKDKTGLSEAKSGAMFVGADASPIYS